MVGEGMGAPWFQIRQTLTEAGVVALSANFTLYGDMGNRMMAIAAGLGPGQEIYSIDKSFIEMSTMRGDLVARSHRVRGRILQWTGIPTGIGIGTTKTLAKLANHVAKAADRKPGSYLMGKKVRSNFPTDTLELLNKGSHLLKHGLLHGLELWIQGTHLGQYSVEFSAVLASELSL